MPASKTKTIKASPTIDMLESAPSFEHALAELERIVAQMESGQMPLEDSLDAYKRGNLLLEHCQKSLADVESQVKILNERQQLVQFDTQND